MTATLGEEVVGCDPSSLPKLRMVEDVEVGVDGLGVLRVKLNRGGV